MDEPPHAISELIQLALAGQNEGLGQQFEEYRAYLKLLAQRQLDSRLEARVDASDIVQQTFLAAHCHLQQFDGTTEAEFVGWLQRIVERNVLEEVRKHILADKRAIGREQGMNEAALGRQSLRQSIRTGSQRGMQGEAAVRLAQSLERLPQDQRDAVRLRHLEGWSLAEIAEYLGRTPTAAAGLVKRGMQKLRAILIEGEPP